MATLTGNKVKDSYQSLLKLSSDGATSTIKTVEDGLGVSTALKISTDTVEVNSLKITTTPTVSSSENTVLVYDDATNEVKARELNTSAFQNINSFSNIAVSGQDTVIADSGTDTLTLVAGSGMTITTDDATDTVTFVSSGTATFANPLYVMRIGSFYALTSTLTTPTATAGTGESNTGSYEINDANNHLQTSSTTSNAIVVQQEGNIRIDVNFFLEVTVNNTDITINVMEKASGGTASVIQGIKRQHSSVGNTAIGFSIYRHASAGMDIYYEISMNSGGGASLLTTSSFSVTKLD